MINTKITRNNLISKLGEEALLEIESKDYIRGKLIAYRQGFALELSDGTTKRIWGGDVVKLRTKKSYWTSYIYTTYSK